MKNLYGFVQDSSEKAKLYPIFVVSLKFSGDEVDVNLEPNKSQVLMKRQVNCFLNDFLPLSVRFSKSNAITDGRVRTNWESSCEYCRRKSYFN